MMTHFGKGQASMEVKDALEESVQLMLGEKEYLPFVGIEINLIG